MNTLGFIMNQLMRPEMAEHMARHGDGSLSGAARLFGKEDLSDPATVGVVRDWLEENGSALPATIDKYILNQPGILPSPYRAADAYTGMKYGEEPYHLAPLALDSETVSGIPWEAFDRPVTMPDDRDFLDAFGYSLMARATAADLRPYGKDMLIRGEPVIEPYLIGFGDARGRDGVAATWGNQVTAFGTPAVSVPTHYRRNWELQARRQ